jgi:threonine aldolase
MRSDIGNFTSDNVEPIAASILKEIEIANAGSEPSYGSDRYTEQLSEKVRELFGCRDVWFYPVATGTAANALALAQMSPSYGGVYCHEFAHITKDECGAPEFFSGGSQLIHVPSPDGKIRPAQLNDAIAYALEMGIHHVRPACVSLSQATEWGTVYVPAEIAAVKEVGRPARLWLHMDGARFANAVAYLGCPPAEVTWKVGVDILSLGATKNGAMCAEAVVIFNPSLVEHFERRRKQAGHLWSKHRFLSAQWIAYLRDDLWLHNARHANAMASRLADGFGKIPHTDVVYAVQANEIFVAMPEVLVGGLEKLGFGFYRWPGCKPPSGVCIRLVTSYVTTPEAVDSLLRSTRQLAQEWSEKCEEKTT